MEYKPLSDKILKVFKRTELILLGIFAAFMILAFVSFLNYVFIFITYFLNYVFLIPFTVFDCILLFKGVTKDKRHYVSGAIVILINILLYCVLLYFYNNGTLVYRLVNVMYGNIVFLVRYLCSYLILFYYNRERKRLETPEEERKQTLVKKISGPFFDYAIGFGALILATCLYYSLAHVGNSIMVDMKHGSDITKIVFLTVFLILDIAYLLFLCALYSARKKTFRHPIRALSITIVSELLFSSFAILASVDNTFVFYPKRYVTDAIPEEAKSVSITVDGNTYTVIFVDGRKENVNLVFLGNGQSSLSVCLVKSMAGYSDQDILFVDYPMFGQSDGPLTEKNIYKEADSFYQYLRNQGYQSGQIPISGFSIGTGVACYLAFHVEAHKLVLAAPYDGFASVMNDYVNICYPPMSFFADFRFPSSKYAKSITCPTTIFYSQGDTTVRAKHTEKLISSFTQIAPEVKELASFMDHNTVFNSADFQAELYGLSVDEYYDRIGGREEGN